ncbi:MAG TPA: glucokinase [Allosphingosinicella sp.]|jgi:glucokinase
MSQIVAVDIGGTHTRFAIAEVEDGTALSLGEACTLKTGEHVSLAGAWDQFRLESGGALPPAAAIAFAGPVNGDTLKLTNSSWVLRPSTLARELGVDRLTIVNDFGAVAHAVAQLGPEHYLHLCGPETDLPAEGLISVVGPGTGLGVAQLVRRGGTYQAVETEGGHIGFAPLDPVEDRILAALRERFGRVSVERLVAGMGLAHIHEVLAAIDGRPVFSLDDKALWTAALDGTDSGASDALTRYCLCLGSVAGDLALAHGAAGVAIAGGLGLRLARHLPRSGFAERFVAKGRFRDRMERLPVKLLTHKQPGLFGAAAAFAREHR